jgi:hypothetical protein
MAVQGVEGTKTRFDQAKRLGGLVFVAIFIAALVVGFLIVTGLFGYAPALRVRILGVEVPKTWTVFIGTFGLALAIILAYVYFLELIRSTLKKVKGFWLDLRTWNQAIVLGFEAGIIALLSVYVTHVLIYRFELIPMLVTLGVVWLIVTFVTLRVHDAGWTLGEWARTVHLSALIAGVVAILYGFAFTGVAPGWTLPLVFLVGWVVATYLLFRRRHAVEDSYITRKLTSTGYAQMRQVDTISVAVGTGLLAALVVAVVVWLVGTTPSGDLQRAALTIAIVWPSVTLATSVGWPDRVRTDLVIDDIRARSSTPVRELTIRNIGDSSVNLHGAKVLDAFNELYHIGIDTTLGAGSRAKFEIPEEFELATHERYEVLGLPFGFSVMRNADDPRIVTRDGNAYVLRWIDQVSNHQ